MSFTEKQIDLGLAAANWRCQCTNPSCTSFGHYNSLLVCFLRPDLRFPVCSFQSMNRSDFHAHHIIPKSIGGLDLLGNMQILCVECHQNTPSYGRRRGWKLSELASGKFPAH